MNDDMLDALHEARRILGEAASREKDSTGTAWLRYAESLVDGLVCKRINIGEAVVKQSAENAAYWLALARGPV